MLSVHAFPGNRVHDLVVANATPDCFNLGQSLFLEWKRQTESLPKYNETAKCYNSAYNAALYWYSWLGFALKHIHLKVLNRKNYTAIN